MSMADDRRLELLDLDARTARAPGPGLRFRHVLVGPASIP
jgi:hypothetical protein